MLPSWRVSLGGMKISLFALFNQGGVFFTLKRMSLILELKMAVCLYIVNVSIRLREMFVREKPKF